MSPVAPAMEHRSQGTRGLRCLDRRNGAPGGADEDRLRRYVRRWFAWLHGGLRDRVSSKGRFARTRIIVLKRLHISGRHVRVRLKGLGPQGTGPA